MGKIHVGLNTEYSRSSDKPFEWAVEHAAAMGYLYIEPMVHFGRELMSLSSAPMWNSIGWPAAARVSASAPAGGSCQPRRSREVCWARAAPWACGGRRNSASARSIQVRR